MSLRNAKLTLKQIANELDKYSDMIKGDAGREADPRTSLLSDRGVRLRDIGEELDSVIAKLDDEEQRVAGLPDRLEEAS